MSLFVELPLEVLLRVETEALPGSRASGASSPLLGGGSGYGCHQQRFNTDAWVVDFCLWINDSIIQQSLGSQGMSRTLTNPGSTTYTMPSMVRDVSAMFVETTTFRPGPPPGLVGPGAASKMRCCAAGGSEE